MTSTSVSARTAVRARAVTKVYGADNPGTTAEVGRGIGQPTQGVFSDVLVRRLPDGLVFGLPNEEFPTRTGRTFDGTRIPPQLTEPVFT